MEDKFDPGTYPLIRISCTWRCLHRPCCNTDVFEHHRGTWGAYDRTATFLVKLGIEKMGQRRTSQFDELLELEVVLFDEVDPPEDFAFVAHVLPQYKCIFEPSAYLGRRWQYCQFKVSKGFARSPQSLTSHRLEFDFGGELPAAIALFAL